MGKEDSSQSVAGLGRTTGIGSLLLSGVMSMCIFREDRS